jgi:GDP-mannose pyrophosphatase NudK
MSDHVRILAEKVLSEAWGLVKSTTLELRRRNGDWQRQVRETYDRGDGAGILLYDPRQRSVILCRQFRFPAYAHGDAGYLVEVPAGKLEGDDPIDCARKEAEEETGYRVTHVRAVMSAYMSPGSVTEKLTLFVAEYDSASRVSDGGGLADEGEDIEVMEVPFDTALAMVETGEIVDAKTIMLLHYAALKRLI